MVDIEDFKYVLTLWKNFKIPDLINRDININLDTNKIITIAGVRRSGKTSIMMNLINKLIKNKINSENIIYINFENDRFININATDMDKMLIAYDELFNYDKNNDIYIFLDEIQNVKNWEKWIRKIYDFKEYKIIISGSSSKLLSQEISTALSGRNINYIIYPLSFKEFLKIKKINFDKSIYYSTDKGIVLKFLDEFMEYGSFPEIAIESDVNIKLNILSSYFDSIFYKDIVERYNIREISSMKLFLKLVLMNYSGYFSSVKLYNQFNSLGYKISRTTILNFIEYVKSTFAVYSVEKYDKSYAKRISSSLKLYSVDTGISNLFKGIDKGRALENIVYMELLRNNRHDDIYYIPLNSGEIDFFIDGKTKEIINVSYDISDNETDKRETKPLIEACKMFNLNNGKIVTYDTYREIEMGNIKITYMPFYMWALNIY
ncbi:MAG: ATP-binding protein [Ferroplasma sp.]